MPPAAHARHDQAVRKLADRYREHGFDVRVEPTGCDIPAFLEDCQPDLIAIGPEKSIVAMVKVGTHVAHGARLQPIAEKVARQPGWEMTLVVLPSEDSDVPFPELPSISDVEARIAQARSLAGSGSVDAALLLVWSAIEAALRILAQRAALALKVSPLLALLGEIYSAGEIPRDCYESLRGALRQRDAVAHGLLADVTATDVAALADRAEEVLREIAERESSTDVW